MIKEPINVSLLILFSCGMIPRAAEVVKISKPRNPEMMVVNVIIKSNARMQMN